MSFLDDWWNAGNKFVIDVQTGGQGVQPGTTTDEYADSYVPPVSNQADIPEIPTEIETPTISANESIITNSPSETGSYKPVEGGEITTAPLTQTFVEKYVDAAKAGEINRLDYTKQSDLGDSKTQELIKQGYSPAQALAMQLDVARGVDGGVKNSRAASYYQNELDKANQSVDATGLAYHADAMASGIPQAPNPFAYSGDLARMALFKSQGVDNTPGTGMLPQFKGSLLNEANIVTKAQRTGEMGDYKYSGNSFSSSDGILSLARQQEIGEAAATSKYNPEPWTVDRSIMDKYTPELAKGAGFNLFYKEAKLNEAKKESPGLLTSDYMASIIPGNKLIGRAKDEVKSVPGAVIQVGGSPAFELVGGVVQPVNKGAVNNMVDMVSDDASFGVVNTDRLAKGADVGYQLARGNGKFNEDKSVMDNELYKTGLSTEGTIGGVKFGARLGSGENVAGQTMASWGILPLYRPPGMGPLKLPGVARKPKHSLPIMRRKSAIPVEKPYKKPYGLMTINDHAILRTIGTDFFKLKVGAINKTVKSVGAQPQTNSVANIKNTFGLAKQNKNTSIKIRLPDIKGISSKLSENINHMTKGLPKRIKK